MRGTTATEGITIAMWRGSMKFGIDEMILKLNKLGWNQTSSEKAYILFYRLKNTPKRSAKSSKKKNIPLKIDENEEWKTAKNSKSKTNSHVNRKRAKTTKVIKSREKRTTHPWKWPRSKKSQSPSWAIKEANKLPPPSHKLFKESEDENLITSFKISI